MFYIKFDLLAQTYRTMNGYAMNSVEDCVKYFIQSSS